MIRSDELIYKNPDAKIIFLHHSTGYHVWIGSKLDSRFVINKKSYDVPRLLAEYNNTHNKKFSIKQMNFPKGNPYPWSNYPFDYYNIWVKNAGTKSYMGEPTLEILTRDYDLIIFKFCFPVSSILEDDNNPDINSDKKTIQNYKLQLNALKAKMREFPKNKFLIWTGAALLENHTTEAEAVRAKEFFEWLKNDWNEEDDNIEIFDFRNLETSGGLYLKPEYAVNDNDSHPNSILASLAAREFVKVITQFLYTNPE